MTMTIKAVIFDLDGTITEPFFDFDEIRGQMGLEPDAGPVLEAMEKMTPEERAGAEEILHYHEQRAVEESRLNEGVRETFDALRSLGIKIGILTRNKRSNALAIAEKHNLRFDTVVDREDGPVKPDGFGVSKICEQFGEAPAETLVVGDFLFDLLSAKAAGAVAVLFAGHKKAQEFAEHADFVIEKIDRILEIVNNKNTGPRA